MFFFNLPHCGIYRTIVSFLVYLVKDREIA